MNGTPRLVAVALLALAGAAVACSPARSEGVVALDAEQFSTRLGATPSPQLVDVRTPGEYVKGHLARAENVDVNAGDFERRTAGLDRDRPVFVYCLTGSRSAVAAKWLSAAGFREVYDLSGGILAWRATGLPQTVEKPAGGGLTKAGFERLVAGATPVLVDFYAEWCIPCRKMKPELEHLAQERAGSFRLERIDADDNQELLRELGVDSLPTVELYRDGVRVWKTTGYTAPEQVAARLDAAP